MLLPDGLSTNAYRVLRLSANASSSEVHKAAERARRASALGLPQANDVDINLLGVLPQTDADVRAAVGRLGNPAHRLRERLFWFHQVSGAELPDPSAPESAFAVGDLADTIRRHDEALRGLFNTFKANLDDAGAAAWVRALRRWHTIVSDDSYWALSAAIENRGGFEPRAISTEVESVRSVAVSFAAHGLLVEGRDALNRNDTTTVQRILGVLGELAGTGSWAHAAQDEIASQAVIRFTKLCQEIRETGAGKMVRENHAAPANKIVTEATLGRFRREVQPELTKLIRYFPRDHDLGRRVRESAAQSLYGIGVDFTWADDFVWAEALYEEALKLAGGTPSAVSIESGLARVRENARTQRAIGKAKPIKAAPGLSTLNGFGVKLYGESDLDAVSGAYTATHYIVALFVPILPIGRYRVINAGGGSYRFLGKLPLRKGDRWHQAIVVAGFLIWLAIGQASSSSPNSSSYATPIYNQVASMDTTAMPGAASVADRDPLKILSPPGPTDQRAASTTSGSPDPWAALEKTAAANQGSTSADQLARIDRGRARTAELETQLNSERADLEAITARINALDSELQLTKAQTDLYSENAVEDYNVKVRRYNTLLGTRRVLFAAFKAKSERYEETVTQNNRLVDQYNSRYANR